MNYTYDRWLTELLQSLPVSQKKSTTRIINVSRLHDQFSFLESGLLKLTKI